MKNERERSAAGKETCVPAKTKQSLTNDNEPMNKRKRLRSELIKSIQAEDEKADKVVLILRLLLNEIAEPEDYDVIKGSGITMRTEVIAATSNIYRFVLGGGDRNLMGFRTIGAILGQQSGVETHVELASKPGGTRKESPPLTQDRINWDWEKNGEKSDAEKMFKAVFDALFDSDYVMLITDVPINGESLLEVVLSDSIPQATAEMAKLMEPLLVHVGYAQRRKFKAHITQNEKIFCKLRGRETVSVGADDWNPKTWKK